MEAADAAVHRIFAKQADEAAQRCTNGECPVASCVFVGGHPSNSTQFINITACDDFYQSIPPLSYSHCYHDYVAHRCSTVVAVYASPLMDNRLYGCIPLDMATVMIHADPKDEYITVDNTTEWREQLTSITPGASPFRFMNEQTAQLSPTGEILRFRIKRTDLIADAQLPR